MKKIISILLTLILAGVVLATLCGCLPNRSLKEYWFSQYDTKFVKYDETANNGAGNLEQAGSYWEMTIKTDCNLKIIISAESILTPFSTMYFYVNGKQVQSEEDTGGFTFVYDNLDLKKGDKLTFHAFWTNSLKTEDKEFVIDKLIVCNDDGNFVITNM